MWRDVHTTHVSIIGCLTMHVWNYTSRHSISRRKRQGTVVWRGGVEWRSILRVITSVRAASPAWSSSTRCESSGCCSGSLFDSAGVMILMAGQGGATSKSLLAIGIWALVRPLSRVDATMSCQRTRVTKRLQSMLEQSVVLQRKWMEITLPHRSHI